MLFFSGLLIFLVILRAVGAVANLQMLQSYHVPGTYAAAIMFLLVGLMHFTKKEKIEAMIPTALQAYARPVNYVSGLLEIGLGILLFFPSLRTGAAYGLMALLVLMFPANIFVAQKTPNRYNISRLFFQPVYIAWVWFFCIYLGA